MSVLNVSPPVLNKIRGTLGLLTAQYVLPVWQRITPIWSYTEEIEKWNLSEEELQHFRNLPDDNTLPERLIELTGNLLEGSMSIETALKKVDEEHIWDVVGALILEFFEVRNDLPLVACHACQTVHTAFYEALGYKHLDRIQNLKDFTDDNLPDHGRDSASHAVIAYSGGTRKEPVDFTKRLEFWEWWLKEAIPTACRN